MARIKVKPLGHVEQQGVKRPILVCERGWSVTCTDCGEVETLGVWFLTNIFRFVARPHLKEKHS